MSTSPPLVCEIITLLFASTEATTFVSPALLIPSAINSASLAAPVAVNVTTADTFVVVPAIVSASVKLVEPALICAATILDVTVEAPDADLRKILNSASLSAASVQLDCT